MVPILSAPLASSRARSIWPCTGRMRQAFSASSSVSGVMVTPLPRSVSISARSAQGSTTTPLPITDSLPGRTTPDGSRLSLYSTSPITSVWPALWPPWNRTTTSARLDSQSTILPLPSSPHWTPTTVTFAMERSSCKSGDARGPAQTGTAAPPDRTWVHPSRAASATGSAAGSRPATADQPAARIRAAVAASVPCGR